MNSKPPSKPPVPEVVPAGAPTWVTRELIDRTIRVWQPYYREPLKPEDALAMLPGVAEFHRVIGEGGWSTKRFVPLARVISSREQEREGFSLEVQEDALKRYALQHGGEIARFFKIAETASRYDERKTFTELIGYTKQNPPGSMGSCYIRSIGRQGSYSTTSSWNAWSGNTASRSSP